MIQKTHGPRLLTIQNPGFFPRQAATSKVNISHQLLGALIKSMNTTAVDMKPQELSNCLLAALQLNLSAES